MQASWSDLLKPLIYLQDPEYYTMPRGLAVTGPCTRRVLITLPQGDLHKDSGILRTAAQDHGTHVGVYAGVVHGGRVRRGDRVSVT